jgi:hypothetical protein
MITNKPDQGGWFKMDNSAAERSSEIGPSAFQVYGAIARYADEARRAWPGIGRLVVMTGLSPRSIRYALAKLQSAGWIVVSRDRGQTNIYTLPLIQSTATSCPTPETGKAMGCRGGLQPVASGKAMGCRGGLQPVAPNKDLMKKTNHKDQVKKTQRGKAAGVVIPASLDCDSFQTAWSKWLAYRTKRKLSKLPETLTGQLEKLAKLDTAGAVAEIKNSIANGWQSVCYPGAQGNGHSNSNGRQRAMPTGAGQRYDATAGTARKF